jgi:hypothetical protein
VLPSSDIASHFGSLNCKVPRAVVVSGVTALNDQEMAVMRWVGERGNDIKFMGVL